MKKLVTLLFLLFSIPSAFAADKYVTPSGVNAKTGADWANAAGFLTITDSSGVETGTNYSPNDMAVSLAYAYPLNFFGSGNSVGISGKYIRSEIIHSASTLTADFGVLVAPFSISGRDLSLSLAVQNLGGRLKFNQESEPLPLNIKLGSALAITWNWLAGLDVNFPKDNRPYAALGTEYRMNYGTDLGFAGRAGFTSRTIGDVSGLGGLSVGAGVSFKQFRLDYAFLPVGSIGVTHSISITFGFAKPEFSSDENFYRKTNKTTRERIKPPTKPWIW